MRLQHGRIGLELHTLSQGEGLPLLLLHALYGSSADWAPVGVAWPGPVMALDFSGHGGSDWVRGGGYFTELLAADGDIALQHLGRAAIAGAGIGAYVALLLAGGRPAQVPAVLLAPGAGLVGGGALPDFGRAHDLLHLQLSPADQHLNGHCDPQVAILDFDVRPVDYIEPFARRVPRLLLVEDGGDRPPWWEVARRGENAVAVPPDWSGALRRLAAG